VEEARLEHPVGPEVPERPRFLAPCDHVPPHLPLHDLVHVDHPPAHVALRAAVHDRERPPLLARLARQPEHRFHVRARRGAEGDARAAAGRLASAAPSLAASAGPPRTPASPATSASASSGVSRNGRRNGPRLPRTKPRAVYATLRLASHGRYRSPRRASASRSSRIVARDTPRWRAAAAYETDAPVSRCDIQA